MDSTAGEEGWPPPAGDDSWPPAAGDARVDEALHPLAQLGEQPVGEHVAAYDDVQRQLQDILGSLDGG